MTVLRPAASATWCKFAESSINVKLGKESLSMFLRMRMPLVQERVTDESWWVATGALPPSAASYLVLSMSLVLPSRQPDAGGAPPLDDDDDSSGSGGGAAGQLAVGVVPADERPVIGARVIGGAPTLPFLVSAFGVGLGPSKVAAAAPTVGIIERYGVRMFEMLIGILVDTAARQLVVVDHRAPSAGAIRIDGIPASCKIIIAGRHRRGASFSAAIKPFDMPGQLQRGDEALTARPVRGAAA